MNNLWVRAEHLDNSFEEMHGVKPTVEKLRISGKESRTRLIANKKEVIITEILERDRTKEAILEYNGVKYSYPRVIDAERAATVFLKTEVKDGDIGQRI